MSIHPVSFGKTVKVNASIDTARRIAEMANSCKTTSCEKPTQRQVKSIFNDVTDSNRAIALAINGGKDVYVVSGKESKKALNLYEKMVASILKVEGKPEDRPMYFDRIMKKTEQRFDKFLQETKEPFEINVGMNHKNTKIREIREIQI